MRINLRLPRPNFAALYRTEMYKAAKFGSGGEKEGQKARKEGMIEGVWRTPAPSAASAPRV
jgi:hypothetical protein